MTDENKEKKPLMHDDSLEELGIVISEEDEEVLKTQQIVESKSSSESTTHRILILAINNTLTAIHMTANGLILSSLGTDDAAAVSLISPIQNFISGIVFGTLLSTGVQLGKTLGEGDANQQSAQARIKIEQEIEATIKMSWLIGGGFGLLGSVGYLTTILYLPKVAKHTTGISAGNYFLGYAIGGFLEPLAGSNRIVITQVEKNMWIPTCLAILYRLPPIGLSYLFAKTYSMGSFGVGLGNSLAGIVAFGLNQIYFSYGRYKQMRLYHFEIPNFYKQLKEYLKDGWKLALQRITEWGNLLIITLIISSINNTSLKLLQPAIQANNLIGLTIQGMGHSAMMFVVQDCEKQKKNYKNFKKTLSVPALRSFEQAIPVNKSTFVKNNLTGLVTTIALSVAIYCAREPLIQQFVPDLSDQEEAIAGDFLLYMLIGLLPDSLRIISGGVLRGWGDLLYPTLVSFFMMTFVGVSVGAGTAFPIDTDDNDKVLYFLWSRIAAIGASVIFNFYRFYHNVQNDSRLATNGQNAIAIYDALGLWEQPNLSRIREEKENKLPRIIKNLGFPITDFNDLQPGSIFLQISNKSESKKSENDLKILVSHYLAKKNNQEFINQTLITQLNSKNPVMIDLIIKVLSKKLKITIYVINDYGLIHSEQYPNGKTYYFAYDSKQHRYFSLPNPTKSLPKNNSKTSRQKSPKYGSQFHHSSIKLSEPSTSRSSHKESGDDVSISNFNKL